MISNGHLWAHLKSDVEFTVSRKKGFIPVQLGDKFIDRQRDNLGVFIEQGLQE